MGKKSNGRVLAIIISYIITRLIFKLTGFSYSLSEGIFNIKLLVDLGLWIIVSVIVASILNKVFFNSEGQENR